MDKYPVENLYKRLGPSLVKPDMAFLQAPGAKIVRESSSSAISWHAVEPEPTQQIEKPTGEYDLYSKNVVERLMKAGNIYQRRQLEHRLQKLKQERDIFTPRHKPTMRPGQSNSSVRLFQLSKQKALKLDSKRREQAKKLAHVNSAPKIDIRSQEIASRKYKGMKVEDRLIQAGQNRDSFYAKMAHMSEIEIKALSQPVLTKHAQSLQRDGKVEDRLMKYKQIYNQKVDTLRKEAEPVYTFKPKINENWEMCPPLELPGDSFDQSSQSSHSPVRQKPAEEFTFKPTICSYSRKLASKSRSRMSHSRSLSSRSCSSMMEEFSFHPKINRRSSRIASSQQGSLNPTWERLYKLDAEQKAKLEERRKEIENLQLNDIDCTFSPKTLSKSPFTSKPIEIAYRLNSWLLQRDNKLKQAQEEIASSAYEECTFKPYLKKLASYKEDKLEEKKGMQSFMKRQEISRRLKAGELPSYSEMGSPSYAALWRSSTRFTERESDADLMDTIERLMSDSSSDRLS